MRHFIILLITIFYVAWNSVVAIAFNDDVTHPEISIKALEKSKTTSNFYFEENLLMRDGIITDINGQLITEWLQYGAKMEDDPMCRASNHFHNPYLDWTASGLSDTLPMVNWWCWATSPYLPAEIKSNVTWATGYADRGYIDPYFDVSTVNGWDWMVLWGFVI